MLEVKGNEEEIDVLIVSLLISDCCMFDCKYCFSKGYESDIKHSCEECIKEHIKFIIEEEES